HLVVRAIGKDCGVLDGDVPLVMEPVRHPAADLGLCQESFVHCPVERVLVVVRTSPDGTQLVQELLALPGPFAVFHQGDHLLSRAARAELLDLRDAPLFRDFPPGLSALGYSDRIRRCRERASTARAAPPTCLPRALNDRPANSGTTRPATSGR